MRPRNYLFITMLALCHLLLCGQVLTNAAPLAAQKSGQAGLPATRGLSQSGASAQLSPSLPDDPGQEILPVAQPEPEPASGVPVEWEARSQSRVGDIWTLTGDVVVHYRDYILRADKVLYHQSTTELEADGHLEVSGGANDVLLYADHGDMRLNMHTARYFNVHGSQGVRTLGRTSVYSTMNPLLFTGRVLLQTSEGNYKLIDGTMTNCLLPKPDWQIIARSINVQDNEASTSNAVFKFLGVPLFYRPFLRQPVEETGRESGFLFPALGNYSTITGYTFGEQYYWAISRSMDMVVGMEYFSKRGWAPNGDFRYKGPGLDHLTARWNALLDRGVELPSPTDPNTMILTNQGGVDINALGRKDITQQTRISSNIEYLSSYVYRLIFNEDYWQAISSEVKSDVSLTHVHSGFVPSASLDRFQTFAGTTGSTVTDSASINANQARILHLPSLRFDVLDRPLGASPLYWSLGSSLGYLSRSEPGFQAAPGLPTGPGFHARNAGRMDFYPHLALPFSAGGWSVFSEAALRDTAYTISQTPDLAGANGGIPSISPDPLNRPDFEASVDVRPPVLERAFSLTRWNRQLRPVIEPAFSYRYVDGIGARARNVLLIDTTDIATNTNEVGYSLTQRFYLRSNEQKPCSPEDAAAPGGCPDKPREWASWQIAQKFFINPTFGGALIPNRRNVFDSTLDLSAVAFLTSPRNLSPITSRLRFEAIDNLRIEWDLDYDPKAGQVGADNLYAGYSRGRTTIGIGHAMLNAVDENNSSSTIKSQQVQPFLSVGKSSGKGFNLAANSGYDFTHGTLQYAGMQAVYNWDCCGLSVGYRRFDLGTIREETQYLYSFTLANFGSVGDIRRSTTAFRDPTLPPTY